MSVNDRKVFVVALMLVALMSVFVSVASATGSQTWYPHGGTSDWLTKSAPSAGSHAIIDDVVWRVWYAEGAHCDLTMPGGTWVLHLDYDAPCTGTIDVKVQNRETGKKLNYKYGTSISGGAHALDVNIDADPQSVDFNADQHLEIKMGWNPSSGTEDLTVYCGDDRTNLSSPSNDPGYPVPELSTLALFSVGLLALVGYVAYRRRNI